MIFPKRFDGGLASNVASGIKGIDISDYFPNFSLSPAITAYNMLTGNYLPSGSDAAASEDVPNYLEGLFASSGKENELNRQYNSAEAKLNRDFQSAEAQIQRDWYEAMSNSAYQRSVADMRKAGINPILAYSQGGAASSGTGLASGSAASYNVNGADRLSDVLSAAADVVNAVAGASGASVSKAFKIFRMAGG